MKHYHIKEQQGWVLPLVMVLLLFGCAMGMVTAQSVLWQQQMTLADEQRAQGLNLAAGVEQHLMMLQRRQPLTHKPFYLARQQPRDREDAAMHCDHQHGWLWSDTTSGPFTVWGQVVAMGIVSAPAGEQQSVSYQRFVVLGCAALAEHIWVTRSQWLWRSPRGKRTGEN